MNVLGMIFSMCALMLRIMEAYFSNDFTAVFPCRHNFGMLDVGRNVIIAGLETLKTRRNKLSLSFDIKCTKNEATRDMFPRRNVLTNTRFSEKFVVTKSCTDRLANSAIPFMQRLLNKHEQTKLK